MSRTTAELATEVMRLPGWLEAQEEPDSQDAAHITRVYSDLYAEWVVREIAYWPATEIPEEVFRHIARIVADLVAPSFGDAAPTEIDIETGAQVSMGHKGWSALKRITQRDATGLPTTGSFF